MRKNLRKTGSPKRSTKSSHRSKPHYDSLEQRLALTVYFVNTLGDTSFTDGQISLREAVTAASTNAAFGDAPAGSPDGDAIRFDSSISGGTINLFRGKLQITDDLLIQGGDRNITINGGGFDKLFEVDTSEQVAFGKLTFQNGRGDSGGAIDVVRGRTTLIIDSVFEGNEATGFGGGAIYNGGGFMGIVNSTFRNNEASNAFGEGGALFTKSGYVFINGGSMTNNTANGNGGAIKIGGGGFFSLGLDIGGAGQLGNSAGQGGQGDGGGIHVSGISFVTVSSGNISGNFATGNGGGVATSFGSNVFLNTGVLVSNNISSGNFENSGGGGVYNEDTNLYLANARVVGNRAIGSMSKGGGILTRGGISSTINSIVENNAAVEGGGGLAVIKGFAVSNNNAIRNNDVGVTLTGGLGLGGGIYVESTDLADQSIFVMNGGQVRGNQATNQGGGVWSATDSLVFIHNGSSIISNQVIDPLVGIGGGFYTTGYVQLLDSFVQLNNSRTNGGGFFAANGAFLRANNSNFNANTADDYGGGLYVDGFVYMTDSSFVNNSVQLDGGAVFTSLGGTFNQLDVTYELNTPNDTN